MHLDWQPFGDHRSTEYGNCNECPTRVTEQKGYLDVGVRAAQGALQLHVGKVDIYFLSLGLCDEVDTLSVMTEGSRQGRKQELTIRACVVPATVQIRWGEQRREGMVMGMALLWLDTSGSIFKT